MMSNHLLQLENLHASKQQNYVNFCSSPCGWKLWCHQEMSPSAILSTPCGGTKNYSAKGFLSSQQFQKNLLFDVLLIPLKGFLCSHDNLRFKYVDLQWSIQTPSSSSSSSVLMSTLASGMLKCPHRSGQETCSPFHLLWNVNLLFLMISMPPNDSIWRTGWLWHFIKHFKEIYWNRWCLHRPQLEEWPKDQLLSSLNRSHVP